MQKQRNSNNDFMKFMDKQDEPFTVLASPLNTAYTCTIDEEFRDVFQFQDIVSVLDGASDGDHITIKLSTIGGALHAVIPLIAALKNTSAYVHVHVESDCASAGTFIMMLAHSCYVNEYATVMLHNVSYGAGGHGSNVAAHVNHTTRMSTQLIEDMYADWLTPEEVEKLLHGMEIYFDADTCHERFEQRNNVRKERYEAEELIEAAIDAEEQEILDQESEEWLEMMEETTVVAKPTRKTTKK